MLHATEAGPAYLGPCEPPGTLLSVVHRNRFPLRAASWGWNHRLNGEVGRIEIVFPGDPDQRE